MTKAAGHGQRRALGIAAKILDTALAELQDVVSPEDCTEKIVMGKIMEVMGRQLQASGGGLDYCVRPGNTRRKGGESSGGRQWRGRWSDCDMAQPTPPRCRQEPQPSVKTEDLCRETGGADQEWEELDRLGAQGQARRKAKAAAAPAAQRSAARRLRSVWPPGCATVFLGVASWQSRPKAGIWQLVLKWSAVA